LLQQGQQQEGVGGSLQQLSLDSNSADDPVVLDVGCGTGLLSMMAATAAAALGRSLQITGEMIKCWLDHCSSAIPLTTLLLQLVTLVIVILYPLAVTRWPCNMSWHVYGVEPYALLPRNLWEPVLAQTAQHGSIVTLSPALSAQHWTTL
jgi:hypothetical protein